MDLKSFYLGFCAILLIGCGDSRREIIQAFNVQDYDRTRELIDDLDDSWETRLYKTKLAMELRQEPPYSVADILPLYQADSTKKYYALNFHYTDYRIVPRAYVRLLIDLVDASKALQKPGFYYPELFFMLRSKDPENWDYAMRKMIGNFNYSRRLVAISKIREIIDDTVKPKSYRDQLRKLAAHFDRNDRETSFYDSTLVDFPYTYQFEENGFYRDSIFVDAENPTNILSTDLYSAPDSFLVDMLTRHVNHPRFMYAFILSNRKLDVEIPQTIHAVIDADSIPGTVKNYALRQLNITRNDTILKILERDSLPGFVKFYLFDQLEAPSFSTRLMDAYFELYRESKLQPRIEKSMQKLRRDSLTRYLETKYSSEINREITYALYFTGINGLKSLKPKVRRFLDHPVNTVRFEAEQTLNRLSK